MEKMIVRIDEIYSVDNLLRLSEELMERSRIALIRSDNSLKRLKKLIGPNSISECKKEEVLVPERSTSTASPALLERYADMVSSFLYGLGEEEVLESVRDLCHEDFNNIFQSAVKLEFYEVCTMLQKAEPIIFN